MEKLVEDKVDTLVVGCIALDTISTIGAQLKMNDSNIGSIRSSIGGVGYNVGLACHYSQAKCRLVSVVGDDFAGSLIISQLDANGLDATGILKVSGSTAQYASNHDVNGELIVACADMSIIEQDFASHIIQQLDRGQPNRVVLDCNISPIVMQKVVDYLANALPETNIIVEPTSYPKAARISLAAKTVFPHNHIDLVTPTVSELSSIYESFHSQAMFDDYDGWFPVLDSLGINSDFRIKYEALANKYPIVQDLITKGVFQQSFQLLPYLPNILVKLGESGVLLFSISTSVDDYRSIPTTSEYRPEFVLTSRGKKLDSGTLGVVVQYFPIPEENRHLTIRNVTGAGDSFLGYLVAKSHHDWLRPELSSVEQEWNRWQTIYRAQLASGKSLEFEGAISKDIASIGQ